jgi:5'-deoxynucleotidase YfbR-like HD superfamily hydrolase
VDAGPHIQTPHIQTSSGRRVNPLAAAPADLDIGDIATSLANQCRFGGHCKEFYSVAQHSCLASDLVLEREQDATSGLWALLHDASEAYLGDLPHPLKHGTELGRLYCLAEDELQKTVCERFGLPPEPPASVLEIDRALLAAERRVLMVEAWEWPELAEASTVVVAIDPWPPQRAFREFMIRYEELERRRAPPD